MIGRGIILFGLAYVCGASACTLDYTPVCGSDGKTYSNECFLGLSARGNADLRKVSDGHCVDKREAENASPKSCICTYEYAPVCGTDGVTYPNKCALECQNEEGELKIAHKGECKGDDAKKRVPKAVQNEELCQCPDILSPVCGSDGVSYPSACEALCSDVTVVHEGECLSERKVRSVPNCVCTFDYRPVCGSDGKTYPNRCALNCQKRQDASLDLRHHGQCSSKSKRSLLSCTCTREYNPMCGSDGKTYNNPCLFRCAAKANNIQFKHGGECGQEHERAAEQLMCPCPKNFMPVCATNGKTYDNPCLLSCAAKADSSLKLAHEGSCDGKGIFDQDKEPICACPKNLREVCATNGKTYLNPCLLKCAAKANGNIKLLHDGPCNGKARSARDILAKNKVPLCPCTRELNEVCGTDGRTYSNPCTMNCAAKVSNVQMKHPGRCGKSKRAVSQPRCDCPRTMTSRCLLECTGISLDSIPGLNQVPRL